MYTHRQGGERERGGREGGLAPSKFELSFSVKDKHVKKTEHLFYNAPCVVILLKCKLLECTNTWLVAMNHRDSEILLYE